jgi:hypothetical protein
MSAPIAAAPLEPTIKPVIFPIREMSITNFPDFINHAGSAHHPKK